MGFVAGRVVDRGVLAFVPVSRSHFAVVDSSLSNRNVVSFRRDHRFLSAESSSEEKAAAAAAAEEAKRNPEDTAPRTIFDKIVAGDIPCDKVHEDDLCLAFRDISPQAPVHVLVIPKNRDGLTMLSKAREDQKDILGHLMYVAKEVGRKECPKGFRIVINDGEDGCQSVYHLHLHVLGKRQMKWPPGDRKSVV